MCLQQEKPVAATNTWGRPPREPALSEVEGSRPSKARQLGIHDAIRNPHSDLAYKLSPKLSPRAMDSALARM